MKRRYFIQTIDEQTGEPAWVGEIWDTSLTDAAQGAMRVGHPAVRVTHVIEQSVEKPRRWVA